VQKGTSTVEKAAHFGALLEHQTDTLFLLCFSYVLPRQCDDSRSKDTAKKLDGRINIATIRDAEIVRWIRIELAPLPV
jgi:hypothetical protein